ncbi:hypothetical protein KY290_001008 [Solanum tuberosum]|uniref:Exo_endo_phos domain-containing protein n=1 Tax=Solanum tuberosum TaxID=4113 RepID=A0ABQ7WN64_SOLTU|nr:hypothetical protein KY290_001008 [Solanum tuberosum]
MREILWQDIMQITLQHQLPWVVCGDFNNVLSSEDKLGSLVTQQEIRGFQNAIDHLKLTNIRATGWNFTWCNKQASDKRVYSKIDWAFGNMQWLQQFGHVEAEFLNPSVSDHSPILIKCRHHHNIHPRVFRFYTNVMEHPDFASTLKYAWGESTRECTMRKIWKKLK